MAKVKLLVDTDIIIDYLNGVKPARDLFRSGDLDIYCSVLSQQKSYKQICEVTKMKMTALDEEEKDILDSYERGEWKPVKNPKHEIKKLSDKSTGLAIARP